MPELYQDDGQVVNEQQGVYQGESELDDVGIASYLAAVLQQVNTVEQPEGNDEDEDEERDEGAEDKYPGQSRLGPSEEETPGANQEDEELESKADQHSITGNITLQVQSSVKCSHLGQGDHEDGTEEGCHGEDSRGDWAEVLATPRREASLTGDLPLGQVLHGVLNVRVICHSRRGFSPILVLKREKLLDCD